MAAIKSFVVQTVYLGLAVILILLASACTQRPNGVQAATYPTDPVPPFQPGGSQDPSRPVRSLASITSGADATLLNVLNLFNESDAHFEAAVRWLANTLNQLSASLSSLQSTVTANNNTHTANYNSINNRLNTMANRIAVNEVYNLHYMGTIHAAAASSSNTIVEVASEKCPAGTRLVAALEFFSYALDDAASFVHCNAEIHNERWRVVARARQANLGCYFACLGVPVP